MVAIEAANGWTAVSRRHSDGSKPKRRITSSSNCFWPSSGKVTSRSGRSPSARAVGDERHLLLLEPVEDLAHLCRLHPGLEVVQEHVVRLVVVVEALDVAAAEVEVVPQRGQELREVGLLARLHPDGHRERGGAATSRRAARRARGAPSPSRGGRRGSGWPRPSRSRASPRTGASSSSSRPISSDVSASCAIRPIVASCSARTAPPPGGIFTCWSQPSSDDVLSRSLDLGDALLQARRMPSASRGTVPDASARMSAIGGLDQRASPEARPTQLQGSWREPGSALADPDSDCATKEYRRAGGGAPRTTSPSADRAPVPATDGV